MFWINIWLLKEGGEAAISFKTDFWLKPRGLWSIVQQRRLEHQTLLVGTSAIGPSTDKVSFVIRGGIANLRTTLGSL